MTEILDRRLGLMLEVTHQGRALLHGAQAVASAGFQIGKVPGTTIGQLMVFEMAPDVLRAKRLANTRAFEACINSRRRASSSPEGRQRGHLDQCLQTTGLQQCVPLRRCRARPRTEQPRSALYHSGVADPHTQLAPLQRLDSRSALFICRLVNTAYQVGPRSAKHLARHLSKSRQSQVCSSAGKPKVPV
jgi:hypothetical protein